MKSTFTFVFLLSCFSQADLGVGSSAKNTPLSWADRQKISFQMTTENEIKIGKFKESQKNVCRRISTTGEDKAAIANFSALQKELTDFLGGHYDYYDNGPSNRNYRAYANALEGEILFSMFPSNSFLATVKTRSDVGGAYNVVVQIKNPERVAKVIAENCSSAGANQTLAKWISGAEISPGKLVETMDAETEAKFDCWDKSLGTCKRLKHGEWSTVTVTKAFGRE